MELAQYYPELENEINVDNRKLVLKRIVKLPRKLHEQMIDEVFKDSSDEYGSSRNQPILVTLQKIEAFLIMKQGSCLAAYEDSIVNEVNNYENYLKKESFDKEKVKDFIKTLLRKCRHGIYEKMRAKESVSNEMKEYSSKVEEFVKSECEDDELTEDLNMEK